jgi:DNA-binding NarL/FixJ family response regulator
LIQVLVVDDHPAVRAGLQSVLRGEPGFVPVAEAANASEAIDVVARARPQVAVLDYHLPDDDGLSLCWRLKKLPSPPRVVIYSAFADAKLAVLARVAGADGVVDKAAPADDLFEVIRRVARGEAVFPQCSPQMIGVMAKALEEDDLSIFGMLVNGVSRVEAAEVLTLDDPHLEDRALTILGRLRNRNAGIRR